MAIWTATNVSLPSNSRIVTVNTGDDVGQMYTGFIIQINDLQFKTVRTVNTGASPQTIELDELYTGASISGGSAIGAPTQGAIKEAAEELRQLRNSYEGLANSVNESGTANSLVRRTAQGRVKAADGVAVDDCVTMSQIGTAAARDVGTSAGNVMEVGAFGWGGLTPASTPNGDLNDIERTGVYDVDGATLNTPSAFNPKNGMCLHLSRTDTLATQLLYSRRTPQMFMRVNEGSGWENWAEFYHSGNSVNPLEYGLGVAGQAPTVSNLNTQQKTGLFRIADSNATGLPEVFLGTMLQNNRDSARRNQIIHNELEMLFRGESSSGFKEWNRVYHSGNSVNPLDYGLGQATTGATLITDFGLNEQSGFYRSLGGYTDAPETPTFNSSVMAYPASTGTNFLYQRNVSTPQDIKAWFGCTRPQSGDVTWVEVYHSGNTNFNEFGGESINDVVAQGVALNNQYVIFYLPINSKTAPTGITVEGLFNVRTPINNSMVKGSVTPIIFGGLSSNKVACIGFNTLGATGLSQGDALELVTESNTSKITVNF